MLQERLKKLVGQSKTLVEMLKSKEYYNNPPLRIGVNDETSLKELVQIIVERFSGSTVELYLLDGKQGSKGRRNNQERTNLKIETRRPADHLEINHRNCPLLHQMITQFPGMITLSGKLLIRNVVLESQGPSTITLQGSINIREDSTAVVGCLIRGPACSAFDSSRLTNCQIDAEEILVRDRATLRGCMITTKKLKVVGLSVVDQCVVSSNSINVSDTSEVRDCKFEASGSVHFVLTRTARLIKPVFTGSLASVTLSFDGILDGAFVEIPSGNEDYMRITLGEPRKPISADYIPPITVSAGQISSNILRQLKALREQGLCIKIEIVDRSGDIKRSLIGNSI